MIKQDARQGGSEAATIRYAAGCDYHDGIASEWALGILAEIDTCRNENGERHVSGMASTLATLRTNDVDA